MWAETAVSWLALVYLERGDVAAASALLPAAVALDEGLATISGDQKFAWYIPDNVYVLY